MHLPDIELLKTFVSIYELGSVSSAAEVLCRSQAAVSIRLKKLEDQVGERLFDRAHGGLVPTKLGEQMFGRARPLLIAHAGLSELFNRPDIEGRVRIGIPDDYMMGLAEVLREFNALYPRVELDITCDLSWKLVNQLTSGELDIALITMHQPPQRALSIRKNTLVWVGARNFEYAPPAHLPLALFPDGCAFRALVLPALDRARIPWRVAFVSQSSQGIQSVVRTGIAVTVMAEDTIPEGLHDMGETLGLPSLGTADISLLVGPGGYNATVRRLRAAILRHFGVHAESIPE